MPLLPGCWSLILQTLFYNTHKVFCQLKLDSNAGNENTSPRCSKTIDGLYGKLDSNYVNGLNIEWQFKIMETLIPWKMPTRL